MELWDAQSVQLVWFLTTTENVEVENFYRAFFKEDPSSVQKNKFAAPNAPFLGMATGPVEGYQAQVQLQHGRLDVFLHANDAHEEESVAVVSTEHALGVMNSGILSIEETLPEAVRLALICNLLKPADTASDSQKIIRNLISFAPDMDDITDLLFQVNRRKTLSTGVTINRLIRWQAITFQSFVLNFPGQQIPFAPPANEKHAAGVLLDLNTIVEPRLFSGPAQLPIFAEMMEEAKRIAQLCAPEALMV